MIFYFQFCNKIQNLHIFWLSYLINYSGFKYLNERAILNCYDEIKFLNHCFSQMFSINFLIDLWIGDKNLIWEHIILLITILISLKYYYFVIKIITEFLLFLYFSLLKNFFFFCLVILYYPKIFWKIYKNHKKRK
jgi:hypothetical protein